MTTAISSTQVGEFVDSIAGDTRTIPSVAGRLLEEAVELCLTAGLSTGDIHTRVTHSIFNQCTKQTYKSGKTVFPGELTDTIDDLPGEIVDVAWALKDLQFLCNRSTNSINFEELEESKWIDFVNRRFLVSDEGTIYTIKPHITR